MCCGDLLAFDMLFRTRAQEYVWGGRDKNVFSEPSLFSPPLFHANDDDDGSCNTWRHASLGKECRREDRQTERSAGARN